MDFTPGTVLEPSMGIGNFFGMLPEKLAAAKLYGVDLDDLTGRIARQLYERMSEVTVQRSLNCYRQNSFPPTARISVSLETIAEIAASMPLAIFSMDMEGASARFTVCCGL